MKRQLFELTEEQLVALKKLLDDVSAALKESLPQDGYEEEGFRLREEEDADDGETRTEG